MVLLRAEQVRFHSRVECLSVHYLGAKQVETLRKVFLS